MTLRSAQKITEGYFLNRLRTTFFNNAFLEKIIEKHSVKGTPR